MEDPRAATNHRRRASRFDIRETHISPRNNYKPPSTAGPRNNHNIIILIILVIIIIIMRPRVRPSQLYRPRIIILRVQVPAITRGHDNRYPATYRAVPVIEGAGRRVSRADK